MKIDNKALEKQGKYIVDNTYLKDYSDFSMDEELVKIDNLKYLPWVGGKYWTQKKKFLIIAESVYDWDEGSAESAEAINNKYFARYVIREHGLYFTLAKPWPTVINSKMARNFERVYFGKKYISDEEKADLWCSVSFHELVQRPMKNVKQRPTKEDYIKGMDVLEGIFEVLKPSYVIFLGTDSIKQKYFQKKFGVVPQVGDFKINNAIPKTFTLPMHKLKMLMIKHPSKYFSWHEWHNFLCDKISLSN